MTNLQVTQASEIFQNIHARHKGIVKNFDAADYQDLKRVGIFFKENYLKGVMDSLQPSVTTGTITTPIQFLQEWLPGYVYVVTAKRKIDDLVGMSVVGSWFHEQVVFTVLESLGNAVPYGDQTNNVYATWNTNYEPRTIVRFEDGLQVGRLEQDRAAQVRIDSAGQKRTAVANNLEILRNSIGFYGYNNGANRTYGFLNDPDLPAYNTVAVGASGFTQWSTKTFLEIWADILQMTANLRTQSAEQIDPEKDPITLAVATASREYLDQVTDFGISVMDMLKKTYPNIRVESAPQMNAANGGENVGYMYAEAVADGSTDGGMTFMQAVPAKFLFLGVQQNTKGYLEDYSNATAGCFVQRAWAVYRVTGI